MSDKVAIVKCIDYQPDRVEDAVRHLLVGTVNLEFLRGKRILVKANLLMKKKPEEAVTTHPQVLIAVVRILQEFGCSVVLGDSPGGPFSDSLLKGVYSVTGMHRVAEETGCELNQDFSAVDVTYPQAKMLRTFQVIRVLTHVDAVVSVCKMKTHGMMTFTGAVKNLFGVIPGLVKAQYHMKLTQPQRFAEHLVDLCEWVKPVFSVMDGIEAMEGNGPSGGTVCQPGVLLASENPFALDYVAASLAGISHEKIPVEVAARKRNLFSPENIEFPAMKPEQCSIKPFRLPDAVSEITFFSKWLPKPVADWVVRRMRSMPGFDFNKCVGCGDCKQICPPQAIVMNESSRPVLQKKKCISCFCCHEVCPVKAIEVQKGLAERVLNR